jgi:uncharacterized membrane protein
MVWALVALSYLIVGALALRGEKQKVSVVKGAMILVAWLPLLVIIHLGPHGVSTPASQLVERL